MSETINIAPRAVDVVAMLEQAGQTRNANYALAVLAVENGQGRVTLDRLSATLSVEDENE